MSPKRTVPRICEYCGIDFLATPSNVQMGGGRFCSVPHRHASRADRNVVLGTYFERTDGCWYWMGPADKAGYGIASVPPGDRSYAHRAVYEWLNGPITAGLDLDHVCHSRAVIEGSCDGGPNCLHRRCVNPSHLEPVTPRVNNMRGLGVTAKNASKTHCLRGHEFTEDNTCLSQRGDRTCRECNRTRKRAAYRGKKGRAAI